jgi:hypothetical protein
MSQSIILTETISSEGSELKIAINSFMEDKLNEFKKIMKQNVDQIITTNLDNFYSKFSEEHEAVLFDKDGSNYLTQANTALGQKKLSECIKELNIIKKHQNDKSKCFVMNYSAYQMNQGNDTCNLVFFKNMVITVTKNAGMYQDTHVNVLLHTLSTDVLFTIKHFQIGFNNIGPQIKFFESHPEYYKGNCLQFEQLCKKEHYAIKKQKQNLQDLININIDKIEHYNTLEKQIKEIENEKEKIRDEKIRMEKEKEKLLIAKQKIKSMKTEIETEKQRLSDMKMEVETEKQKIKTEQFNIDEYFDEW